MSIRTYIFTLLTTLVLIIAVLLSYQSGRLFIGAFDMSIEKIMFKIAQEYPEGDRVEQNVLGFHVTTDWQKVPQSVKAYFPEIPQEKNIHHSIFVDWIYIAPPEKAYSLMIVERDGKDFYVSRFNEHIKSEHKEDAFFIDPMVIVVLLGLFVIILFVLTLLSIFKKIAVPVESLQQWAKKLTIADLNKEVPDFKYVELNALADLIHENLASVDESIKREQRFLSYASHELRTPIAVLRSNTALLEKINPEPSNKERIVRDRIARASLTMKSMTETLLWLSREGEIQMPLEPTCLGDLVKNIQQELKYLLVGKNVKVNVELDENIVELPLTASVIVLNNLIRNAFQHTQEGHVDIVQKGDEITITNVESDLENQEQLNEELGFGLGMQLVEKLTMQFGWQYRTSEMENGYQVSVIFS